MNMNGRNTVKNHGNFIRIMQKNIWNDSIEFELMIKMW